jgi:ribosome-associated protein
VYGPSRVAARLYSTRTAEEAALDDQIARASTLAHDLVDVLVDRQASDVVLLDLTRLSAFADYFVIATVDNVRQARAVVDALDGAITERGGDMQAEGDPETGWMLVDAGQGVFVHLFSMEQRVYYNLEGLWHRAQEVVRVQ